MERDRFLREAVRRKMRDDQLASSALVTSGAGDLAPFQRTARQVAIEDIRGGVCVRSGWKWCRAL